MTLQTLSAVLYFNSLPSSSSLNNWWCTVYEGKHREETKSHAHTNKPRCACAYWLLRAYWLLPRVISACVKPAFTKSVSRMAEGHESELLYTNKAVAQIVQKRHF